MPEERIKALIERALNLNASLEYSPVMREYATIEIYDESVSLTGDGERQETSASIQVNLYYSTRLDRDSATYKLQKLLEEECGTQISLHRYYDTIAKKYRAALDFELWMEV